MSTREEVANYMRSLGVCESVISDEAGYVAEHYKQEEGEDPMGVVRGSLPSYMNRCHGAGVDALDPTEARESTSFPYQPPPSVYVPPVRLPGPNVPPTIPGTSLPLAGGPAPMTTTGSSGLGGLFASSAGGGVPMWLILAGVGVGLYFTMKGR